MNTMPTVATMEKAYLTSDPAYDGYFFPGIRTTGIYCRPTCPARKAQLGNVEYFPTPGAALAAGYRACKRCLPDRLDDQPQWATDLIREVETNPTVRISDADLKERGIDPGTVRRYFRRRFGLTFQAFARAHRLSVAFTAMKAGASLDDAVFESGYDSYSGFRSAFDRAFGKNPGGDPELACVQITWLRTPIGGVLAGATDEGVCLLDFVDRHDLEAQLAAFSALFRLPLIPGVNSHLETLREELDGYFAGSLQTFSVPLVFTGTPFQQEVWQQLRAIPYGVTWSYADLAAALNRPQAVRAVGSANGRNLISVVVPCHRVVTKGGQPGGYRGGLRRKQYLLQLERESAAAGG
jgi:AraC family transcriptional regulator of adaptative response/methylated-DNA-[protein]-cysteine methyltransferase